MEKPLFVLFLLLFEIILSAQSNHSPFHLKFHEVEKHAIENMKDDKHRIEEWKKNQGKTFGEASNFEPES
jgi:hypothetical protein